MRKPSAAVLVPPLPSSEETGKASSLLSKICIRTAAEAGNACCWSLLAHASLLPQAPTSACAPLALGSPQSPSPLLSTWPRCSPAWRR